jgi:hypothetical protein
VAGYLSTAYQIEVALVLMLAVLIARAGRQRAVPQEASP